MKQFFQENKAKVENFLKKILPHTNDKLSSAMRYSVFNGGKRLRPSLTYATGKILEKTFTTKEMINLTNSSLNAAAASIELIHCYSLVHDDLPAMDDDDLRRNNPTCHIKYDEATAILVGDSLLTLAFELLSNEELNPIHDKYKIKMINKIAKASGCQGMIMGQMQDMEAQTNKITLNELKNLHANKTGKLFTTSIHLGLLASQFDDIKITKDLLEIGNLMGVLFQIQDDILDETSTSEIMGKDANSDKENDKTTYVSLLGLENAKQKAKEITLQANFLVDKLYNYPNLTNLHLLKNMIDFFVSRNF